MSTSEARLHAVLRGLPEGTRVLAAARAPEPARWRLARSLLEEAAAFGGGQHLALPVADLLIGAAPAAVKRAEAWLRDVTRLPTRGFRLPEETAELENWLARQSPPPVAEVGIAALEARCAALPLERAARLTLFAEGEQDRPVAQRLGPAPLEVEEPDLAEQARDWLCRRVLAALTDPAAFARLPPIRPGLRLMLDLPGGALPGGGVMQRAGSGPPPIALIPAAALGTPGHAAREAQLRAAGWAVAHVAAEAAVAAAWRGPGLLAAPAPAEPTPILRGGFIALGPAVPAWCAAPGILRELPA